MHKGAENLKTRQSGIKRFPTELSILRFMRTSGESGEIASPFWGSIHLLIREIFGGIEPRSMGRWRIDQKRGVFSCLTGVGLGGVFGGVFGNAIDAFHFVTLGFFKRLPVAAPIGRVSRWRIGVFEVSLSHMDRRAFLASMGWGGAWLAASDLDAAERRAVSQSAAVLIVGGGVGGVAAALAACRAGQRVVLTEETLWIGGQLTSQAVPPDEHPWIEESGCTRSYREFRDEVRRAKGRVLVSFIRDGDKQFEVLKERSR